MYTFIKQLRADVKAGRRQYWQHPSGRLTWLNPDVPHKAFNYVVQSTARELLVDALFRLDDAMPGIAVIPVHDELVTLPPEGLIEHTKRTLSAAMRFDLPAPDGGTVPIVGDVAGESGARRWWSAT